jgi:hypothetical protein
MLCKENIRQALRLYFGNISYVFYMQGKKTTRG